MTHRSCSVRGPLRILTALSCVMVLTSGVTHASAQGWKIQTIPQLQRNIDHLYHRLLAQLRGPARAQLVADEARWVTYRQQEYRGSPNVLNSYVARLRRLQELERQRPMGPWPFVGDYAIIQRKNFRYGDARDVAHYPQFDNHEADSVSTNQFFAQSATRRVEALNTDAAGLFNTAPPHGEFYPSGFEYYQSFDLYRPGPYLLDIQLFISRYTGGAQEMRSGASYLIIYARMASCRWRVYSQPMSIGISASTPLLMLISISSGRRVCGTLLRADPRTSLKLTRLR